MPLGVITLLENNRVDSHFLTFEAVIFGLAKKYWVILNFQSEVKIVTCVWHWLVTVVSATAVHYLVGSKFQKIAILGILTLCRLILNISRMKWYHPKRLFFQKGWFLVHNLGTNHHCTIFQSLEYFAVVSILMAC